MDDSSSLTPARQELDLDGPGMTPPSGVIPNFEDPVTGNNVALPIVTCCIVLVSIFSLVRFYTKSLNLKKIHIGDVLSLFAFLTFLGTNLYLVIMMLVKVAILFEWIAIFVPTGTRNFFFWASYAVIGINLIYHTLAVILVNINCTPHALNWNPFVPGVCRIDIKRLSFSSAIINLILDLIPLILPQHVIWRLRMSNSKKVGVSIIFLVGLLACLSALIRLVSTIQFKASEDTTYSFSALALYSLIEVTCGFLVVSVPSVPKAIATLKGTKALSWLRTSARGTRGSTAAFWPGSSIKTPKSTDYQDLDERSLVPLTPVAGTSMNKTGGITRTTHFAATSEECYDPDVNYSRQHPWTRGSP
ncbi:hypothetical protein DL767_004589 [Monosporascus sp. MG133]|nr:hypothetical protein DL767_004589 [Monosporascus sp. MG133]